MEGTYDIKHCYRGFPTDFCILTLYSVTLLNSNINSSSFFVALLGFCRGSCHLQRQFYFFLSSLYALLPSRLFFSFIFFALLHWLGLHKILNRSGERRYHCLVLHLKGKTCSLLPLSMMLALGFL